MVLLKRPRSASRSIIGVGTQALLLLKCPEIIAERLRLLAKQIVNLRLSHGKGMIWTRSNRLPLIVALIIHGDSNVVVNRSCLVVRHLILWRLLILRSICRSATSLRVKELVWEGVVIKELWPAATAVRILG